MSHYIKQCSMCEKIIGQCRCAGVKTVQWELCATCKNKYKDEALDSKETLLETYRAENAKLKDTIDNYECQIVEGAFIIIERDKLKAEVEKLKKPYPIGEKEVESMFKIHGWLDSKERIALQFQLDTANKRLGEYRELVKDIPTIQGECLCDTCGKFRELDEVEV